MPCVMVTRRQYEQSCNKTLAIQHPIKPRKMLKSRRRRSLNVSSVHDLHMAIVANQLPMVSNILMNFEGDINGKVKGATALGVSLYKHRYDIFVELIEFHKKTGLLDLDLTSRDHLGRDEPPIVTAARLRFFRGVNSLLEAGADIDGMDNFGHTALWFAVHHRLVPASEQLIFQGANVSKTDAYNFTPLYLTLNLQLEEKLIYLLLYSGSNVDSPNLHTSISSNKTLLSLAMKYGSESLMYLLLELGVGHQQYCPRGSISHKLHSAGLSNKNDPMCKTVWQTCSNPLSLQTVCRSVIRKSLGMSCQSNARIFTMSISQLPLPNDIKRFLLIPQLHDHFSEMFSKLS